MVRGFVDDFIKILLQFSFNGFSSFFAWHGFLLKKLWLLFRSRWLYLYHNMFSNVKIVKNMHNSGTYIT